MMADHQTTGGYTKIAGVISVDLPLVAQSRPGYKVHFQKVTVEEAQKLYIEQVEKLKALKEELAKVPEPCGELDAVIQVVVGCESKKYWNPIGTYRVVIDGTEYMVELEEETERFR